MFKETNLKYKKGGHPSGFTKTNNIVHEAKLYMVKGKRDIRIVQVIIIIIIITVTIL